MRESMSSIHAVFIAWEPPTTGAITAIVTDVYAIVNIPTGSRCAAPAAAAAEGLYARNASR